MDVCGRNLSPRRAAELAHTRRVRGSTSTHDGSVSRRSGSTKAREPQVLDRASQGIRRGVYRSVAQDHPFAVQTIRDLFHYR